MAKFCGGATIKWENMKKARGAKGANLEQQENKRGEGSVNMQNMYALLYMRLEEEGLTTVLRAGFT